MRQRTYIFIALMLVIGAVLLGCRQSAEGDRVVTRTVTAAPTEIATALLTPVQTVINDVSAPTGTPLPTEVLDNQSTAMPVSRTSLPTLTPATIAPVDDERVWGDPDAPVTLIEFSDYQCPFCARHFLQTWPLIKEHFVDTGRVKYVFKDFPLTSLHPQALQAHTAAHCAGEQTANAVISHPYWAMHDVLYERQETWSGQAEPGEVFKQFARDLGLDVEAFASCLESERWREAIAADLNEGARPGVTGTPSFFVDGYPIFGAREFDLFAYAIELAEQGTLGGAYQPREE
jgi:protein-disulfide isomerase